MIPKVRNFIINAGVPAIHVDQIYAEQTVVLRFPAFDPWSIPDLIGPVVQVSPDASIDEQTSQYFYKTEVSLSESEQAMLEHRELLARMPGEAYIQRRNITPLSYLDLSRFDAAPLIAFTATKEIDYGTETDGRF